MKININFKELFQRNNQKLIPEGSIAWPVNFFRDWKRIVITFAIGLLLMSAFAWQIYLSDKIAGGYLAPVIEQTDLSVKTLDKKRLKADVIFLDTRQADYLKLKASRTTMVDPAL